MGQLAVRQVDRTPLLEEGQNLGLLPDQEPVDGPPARHGVVEAVRGLAVTPPPSPLAVQLQHHADARQRPARLHGVVGQVQQEGLGGAVDSGWDRAAQPQAAFPAGPPARRLLHDTGRQPHHLGPEAGQLGGLGRVRFGAAGS